MDVWLHVDRDLLVEQLVFTVQLSFLALHGIVNRVQISVFVIVKTVLLSDVVKLQLGGNCLADNVAELVHVWHLVR